VNPAAPIVAINLIPLRASASIDAFSTFSAELDQPTCLAQTAVQSFSAFAVRRRDPGAPKIDIVEVMQVSSWDQWVETRDALPEMASVTRQFDKLVDAAAVRTLFSTPILPRA
jgi:hypothetical protein